MLAVLEPRNIYIMKLISEVLALAPSLANSLIINLGHSDTELHPVN